ncbi:hypothetical protein UPYG_G00345090 [Umbra pygmaea]|uniref:Uncharacterized protein n=1 Tax=Umbra pygmaea TaxID=75934 RepID=A0ABD0WGB8_UMBPY
MYNMSLTSGTQPKVCGKPSVVCLCDKSRGLRAQERRLRMWLKEDSLAFQDLSSLVLDKRLLRDMKKDGPVQTYRPT